MNNVLLLACRSPFLDDDKVYPPLANLYLHQAIKETRPHVSVTVSDDYDLSDPSWLKGYDGIGVSVMTPQRTEARRVLEFIKEHSSAKTFVGGPHVKHYIDNVIDSPWDYIVPLDGERAILDVIDEVGERVKRDFITVKEYRQMGGKPNRLDNREFLQSYGYRLDGRVSTTLMTARGCPMACTFCEDAQTMVRWTPMDKLKQELDDIKELGYGGIYIFDDLFAIAMPKVRPICDEISKRGFIYRCNGQANFFTRWGEDFAKMLADSGCVEIAFGHESGDQRILDTVRKRTSVEQNYQSVEFARKHGLRVKSFLMLGLPGEDYESIEATERFIRDARPDDFQLAIYYPYKGTQIRDAIERGEGVDLSIMDEGLGAYGQRGGSTEAVVRTGALSEEDLLRERDRLVETYRPKAHDHFFDTHMEAENG